MDCLYNLINSCRSLKSMRKEFFSLHNSSGLMGKEGDKLDLFLAQSSQDISPCKLEDFRWTDYTILIVLNTLRSSDKNKEKLQEELNKKYDEKLERGDSLHLAIIQGHIRT